MAKKTEADAQPPTERVLAPETVAAVAPQRPLAPRQMRIERENEAGVPVTRRFPQVRAGTCEFCGVIDPKYPAQYQYKLCPHYRGQDLWCSYCPGSKNREEVVAHSIMNIAESPDGTKLIVWCDSLECSDKHMKRFGQALH